MLFLIKSFASEIKKNKLNNEYIGLKYAAIDKNKIFRIIKVNFLSDVFLKST